MGVSNANENDKVENNLSFHVEEDKFATNDEESKNEAGTLACLEDDKETTQSGSFNTSEEEKLVSNEDESKQETNTLASVEDDKETTQLYSCISEKEEDNENVRLPYPLKGVKPPVA